MASKVALVTGASSGMGLAVTKDLLSKGWRVCLVDKQPLPSSEEGDLLSGDNTIFQTADISNYDELAATFQATWSKWAQLDFVFANAGIGESGGFVKLLASPPGSNPPEKPDLKTIDIDLIGTTYTVYLAAHYLRQNATPGGKIVATSSSLGFYGEPMFPLYCAAKAGIIALVRSLGPELAAHSITFNCICPGMVPTAINQALVPLMPPFATPLSAVVTAVNRFLYGSETGCAGELSVDKIYIREALDYPDDEQREILTKFGSVVRELAAQGKGTGNSYTTTKFQTDGEQPSVGNPMGNPALGEGTVTGGANWVGYLTASLNESLIFNYNYGVSGAAVDNEIVKADPVDLAIQIQNIFEPNYVNNDAVPWAGDNSLFAIWIGINDIRSFYESTEPEAVVPELVDRYFSLVDELYRDGARQFLFLNVPSVTRSPRILEGTEELVKKHAHCVDVFNIAFDSHFAEFKSSHEDVTAVLYDSWTFMTSVLDNPAANGFDNTICIDGEKCVWGDSYHPTSAYHRLQAADMKAKLGAFGVW